MTSEQSSISSYYANRSLLYALCCTQEASAPTPSTGPSKTAAKKAEKAAKKAAAKSAKAAAPAGSPPAGSPPAASAGPPATVKAASARSLPSMYLNGDGPGPLKCLTAAKFFGVEVEAADINPAGEERRSARADGTQLTFTSM